MQATKSLRAVILVVLLVLGSCSSDLRVSDDEAGVIERLEWIDYPAVATDIGQDLTPRVPPSSTPTRIVIALWSGSARPGVRVSASGPTDQLRLTVEVSDRPGGDVRSAPNGVLVTSELT